MEAFNCVLARWAEVRGNGCGSGTLYETIANMLEPTFVIFSDPSDWIPSVGFRTKLYRAECGKWLAKFFPFAKGRKPENFACISWAGRWVGRC